MTCKICKVFSDQHTNLEIADGHKVIRIEMAKLWLLGDRFLMPKPQNAAMRALYNSGKEDWCILSNNRSMVFESARRFFESLPFESTPKTLAIMLRYGLMCWWTGLQEHPNRFSLWMAFSPEHRTSFSSVQVFKPTGMPNIGMFLVDEGNN